MSFDYEQFSADILASRAERGLKFLAESQVRDEAERRQRAIEYARAISEELVRVLASAKYRGSARTRLRACLQSLNWELAATGRYSSAH